jgi:hypothetical protein
VSEWSNMVEQQTAQDRLPAPRPNRRRMHMAVTVHMDTVTRMDQLCGKFESTRGRLIDRLVEMLHRSYETGTVHCIHGQPCQIGRKDLPAVF